MTLTFEIAGSVLSFNATDFRARLAEACIVPVASIALTIAAGSVIVHQLDGGAAAQRFPDANSTGALVFSALIFVVLLIHERVRHRNE